MGGRFLANKMLLSTFSIVFLVYNYAVFGYNLEKAKEGYYVSHL